MDIEMVNWAIDSQDERNYNYWEMVWTIWDLPISKIIDDWVYQNQWLYKETAYFCVAYSHSHWSNIENSIEWSWDRITWLALGREMVKKWLLDTKVWAYIIDWAKTLKDLKFISWFAQISTIDEIKHSIFNNRPVTTGSNTINWKETVNNNNIAVRWNSYWHAFLIIGYNDETKLLICKNSYWTEKFDKGRFYIKYEDFDLLYNSKFSLIDQQDQSILNYKKKIMENLTLDSAKKAMELGIWNWENPNSPISREETSAMLYRLYEKLQK
jgi:hypothetical protein